MSDRPTILYCNCSFKDLITDELRQRVLDQLSMVDARIVAVPDMCRLTTEKDRRLTALAASQPLTIIACYPRAVRWLFEQAGLSLPENTTLLNMRTDSIETISAHLSSLPPAPNHDRKPLRSDTLAPDGEWVPWFPVIDYDLCTTCKQCQSFCPFGVYSFENNRVEVTHPESCKNNCPACARVCPSVAIIFPKCPDTPINGSEVTEDDKRGVADRVAAQTRELQKDGIHSVLAKRKLRALAKRMAAEYTETGSTTDEEPS